MKLGFLTACLPSWQLADIAAWAAGAEYEALEVAAWPRVGSRAFEASHIDVANFDRAAADDVHALFDKHGLGLSAIGYYENNLHGDESRREQIHEHLRHCIDAASLLGCPYVGTFIGRDIGKSVQENLELGERILPPLTKYAEDHGVRLVVENCPMEGWHLDGYPANLAYSPELWEWMFTLGFYLNYDPSHLVWLGIDPVTALQPYTDRVLHTQAKDAEVNLQARNRYGIFGKTQERKSPWDIGWWRYRIPGLGDVDWRRVVDTLYEGGYEGTVSVEHEDPVWGGTDERVTQGLQIAHRTLRPLIVA
ncbi:MAG: TIM barrel protein [Streptosporangiales bacterium]|nr:TIM barrel protein [Streptosporangiales bacterium]